MPTAANIYYKKMNLKKLGILILSMVALFSCAEEDPQPQKEEPSSSSSIRFMTFNIRVGGKADGWQGGRLH